jgi:multiple sugar transport system ATP-binding protein
LIDNGKIVETGTPHELYGSPSHTFVASMLGSPVINLVKGKISQTGASRKVELPFGDLALDGLSFDSDLSHGDAVTLGIRPQDLQLSHATRQATSSHLSVTGRIHLTEPLGDVTILDVDVSGNLLKIVLPEEKAASYSSGQDIDLYFQASDTHLFNTDSGIRIN